MPRINVSRLMSTQHPDNVNNPFFCSHSQIGGDDEIKEAFYTFSHIKCREQLWDCEGKEVDNFVVKKLLTNYERFFKQNKLGKDVFLTLRVPNPAIEKEEAKILLETLESIPRSFDVAKIFYNEDITPIFEIALPMTTRPEEVVRILKYYKGYVVGKKNNRLLKDDITIADWIGDFKPDSLRIIPLIEDMNSILNADNIVRGILKNESVENYQRVWLARSDPALNYGSLTAVLMEKIALQKLHELEQETSIEMLPILGCGSAPFRGNFKPTNVENNLKGYPSVHTFTIQSAFKYDYEINDVIKAVDRINNSKRRKPIIVDETKCLDIINRLTEEYQNQIRLLAPYINDMAAYIPSRRKRKLHIGLFGYSRSIAGIKLPRAINFCAALYSYGLPPEILGTNALNANDIDYIAEIYPSFYDDMKDALAFLNIENLKIFPEKTIKNVENAIEKFDFEVNEKHKKVTSIILEDLKRKDAKVLEENITRAGFLRKFLG